VFENTVLRRIFGPKRKEVEGGWRILHNEESHNLYASPNIIAVVKSSGMGWAEYVAHIGEMRNVGSILVGEREGKTPLEDLNVDGNIILDWILGK
jgi:hypothetical protein